MSVSDRGYQPLTLSRLLFGERFLLLPEEFEINGPDIRASVTAPSSAAWLTSAVPGGNELPDWWGMELATRLMLEHSAAIQHGRERPLIPMLFGIPQWEVVRPVMPGELIEARAFIETPEPEKRVCFSRMGYVQLRRGCQMLAHGTVYGRLARETQLGFDINANGQRRPGDNWAVLIDGTGVNWHNNLILQACTVVPDDPFWAPDHFRGKAIMPGSVVLSYAYKALVAWLTTDMTDAEAHQSFYRLRSVRNWQVKGHVQPGDHLHVVVEEVCVGDAYLSGQVSVVRITDKAERVATGYLEVTPELRSKGG